MERERKIEKKDTKTEIETDRQKERHEKRHRNRDTVTQRISLEGPTLPGRSQE